MRPLKVRVSLGLPLLPSPIVEARLSVGLVGTGCSPSHKQPGFQKGDWCLGSLCPRVRIQMGLPKKQPSPSWPTEKFWRQQNPLLKYMEELAKIKVEKILF